jgi:cell division protein FtsQ
VSKRRIIVKILFFTAWLLVVAGITVLLIAANKKHVGKTCRDVVVTINGTGDNYYVESADIILLMEKANKGKIVNKSISQISPELLEAGIKKHKWIRDAELYFDREDVLHVMVDEREPIARVIDVNGGSFYIDSTAHRMPLLEDESARVPVFTGFPGAKKLSGKDSGLLQQVRNIAVYIYNNSFWNAQTGQVDITPDGKFEIIPVIGDHVIRLGYGEEIEKKLDRTLLFYRKVLARTGFSKYSVLDVQFEGQVIGVHRGEVSAVDSIQLQKNIEELLAKSNIQNLTADMLPDASPSRPDSGMMNATVPVNTNPIPAERPEPGTARASQVQDPLPERTNSNNNSVRSPRAVMRPRTRGNGE